MVGPPEPEPSPFPIKSKSSRITKGPHDGFLDDFPGCDLIVQPIMQAKMQITESLRICR